MNVIGYKGSPEDRQQQWTTMIFLRSSVEWMRAANDNGMFDRAIEKEKDLYRLYLREYVKAA